MDWLDANWLDASCFAAGFLNVGFQRFRSRSASSSWTGKKIFWSFVNGLGVPPLVILIFATLASGLLAFLASGSRITLAIAGLAGLLALLDMQGPLFQVRRAR
jgi:hypothetical protein